MMISFSFEVLYKKILQCRLTCVYKSFDTVSVKLFWNVSMVDQEIQ